MKKIIIALIFTAIQFTQLNAQSWQWAKKGASVSSDYLSNICTDANGNAYVIGQFGFYGGQPANYMIFDNDTVYINGVDQIFLVKYSPSGNVVWAKSIGGNNPNTGASSYTEGGYQVHYDASSNSILITGSFSGTCFFGPTSLFGIEDMFLAKLDLNGNYLWVKGIYCNNIFSISNNCLSSDPTGNIYMSGISPDSISFDSTKLPAGNYLTKYDSNGNVLWAKKKFVDAYFRKINFFNGDLFALGIITNDTSLIDTVTYISNLSSTSFFTRFDTSGNVKWIKFPTSSAGAFGSDMDMDAMGAFYINGSFKTDINLGGNIVTNANLYDMFIVKYDANGNVIWLRQANASNSVLGYRGVTTGDGSTYVEGLFDGSASFGSYNLTSTGSNDIYIARYNSNGDCLGVRQIAIGNGTMGASWIAADNLGNCFIAGSFYSPLTIGSTTLSSAGFSDVFIAKHDVITGLGGGEGRMANQQLIIYANPTAGKCNITVPDDFVHEQNLTLSIYDNTGKLIQQKTLEMISPLGGQGAGKIKVNLEQEAKGVYNVTLSNKKKSYNGTIVFE